jgi:hypothetical protein
LEPTEGSRVLQIEFPLGAEEIEIVGTPMDQDQQPPTEPFSLEIEGQTCEIEYEIAGGTVESIAIMLASAVAAVIVASRRYSIFKGLRSI